MRLFSSAFRNGEPIPRQYSRDGADQSPPLHIEGVPVTAKSLVLIVEDPDAPRGTFTHWILFNLDPKRVEIEEDQVPEEARQGTSDWGQLGWGGPKPPSGEHRYVFRLYALDLKLPLPEGVDRPRVEAAMKGHVLASTELMGRYAVESMSAAAR